MGYDPQQAARIERVMDTVKKVAAHFKAWGVDPVEGMIVIEYMSQIMEFASPERYAEAKKWGDHLAEDFRSGASGAHVVKS